MERGAAEPVAERARRRRSPRPVVAVVLGVALVVAGVVAVATVRLPGAVHSCVDWATFPDDASRTEAADLVVDATVVEQTGTRSMFGEKANVWEVEVETVVKGDAAAGDHIEVVSTPPTCSGETYPEGDPLDVDDEVRLYLKDAAFFQLPGSGDGWALITPFDGVGQVP
jgi:hypothetical protein